MVYVGVNYQVMKDRNLTKQLVQRVERCGSESDASLVYS